jgi:GT2 family glycosyltransferase
LPHPSDRTPPRVRVVVVNWNGEALLPACLDSLEAQTCRADLDVVVVDNGSTDGSLAVLDRYPGVRVVRSPRNTGFAGGVALGTAGLDAEHVVLLNTDATFAPDAVARLLAAVDAPGSERVGAVTAKILLGARDAAGPRLVNSTGNVVTRRGTGGDRDWLVPDGQESTDPDVFGFCGGAALLRGAALRDVGGFDASLFLYYEDTDVSWRLRSRGWTVRYEAAAVAHHLHAASSDATSPLFRYYNTRNSLTVFARHAPAAVVLGSFARQLAGAARAALAPAASGHPGARWRGIGAFLRALPRTLAARRRIARAARVPRRDVARYLRG